jgi:predicted alpha/beta superfamily hydrolase
VKITVKVPKDTESKYRVYLSGNLGEVGNGKPDGVPLEELTAGAAYLFDMQLPKGQKLQYKITCGSLDTVEVGADGKRIEPRVLNLDQDHDEKISVARWLFRPETPKSTVTGKLRLHENFHSAILNNNRTLRVWLPPNYDEDRETRYAVLYLHDGQSCFDAMTSYSGEFEADEAADQLIRAKKIPPIIMVGIDNNPDRSNEMTPTFDANFASGPPEQRTLGGGGKGESYAQFIITEVKPFIDQQYRTLPDREHTATAGSSFGGLISLYLGHKHGDVFSRIGAMSTALGWDKQAMLNEIINDPTALKQERVWLDMGTYEGTTDAQREQHMLPSRSLAEALRQRGMRPGVDYAYLEDPGAKHLPRAWARRFPRVLEFLFAQR